jgi:hypothetical protein
LFFVAQSFIFFLYSSRLKERQKEIERLASENRQYRERFMQYLGNVDEEKKNHKSKKSGRAA